MGIRRLWSSRGQRVLLISIVVCVVICVVLFSLLGLYVDRSSRNAVDDIGEMTMRDASYQLTKRFETVMDQRLAMVKALHDEHGAANDDEAIGHLATSASLRGFKYLAFMRVNEELMADEEKGRTIDYILGEFVVFDIVPFRSSILRGEEKIAIGKELVGRDAGGGLIYGEDMVMFAVPSYDHIQSETGEASMTLIAGVSHSEFVEMLDINNGDNTSTAAYIIREDKLSDGETNSLILKPDFDASYTSLSELLKDKYRAEAPVDTILRELNESMNRDEVYSNLMHVADKHIHMYCNVLSKSEWYLVTLTNNAKLNATVDSLTNRWTVVMIISVTVVLMVLIAIFIVYNHYNKKTLKKLDKARQEATAASRAKSEFLSNMSHDIRTPMNAIVGMTAIATANIDNREQVQDCLKKITLSSKHLLGLINDVLDMSKIESGKMTLNMERISLREILDGIATIAQPQIKIKKQRFDIVVDDIITEDVYCDSVRLNQVLLNLLSNAIKFTPENGSIKLSLTQEASPRGDDFVRNHIRVADNGMGMSPEFVKKVFESFVREDNLRVHKTEGTGLGMTITKYIVDAMNGTIDVQSEPGKGTKFHVVLDLEKVEGQEEEIILPDWHMLVVDDDEHVCRTTVLALKDIGIRGDWTLTGESAVDMTVNAKGGDRYDIVMLDWQLPGIDGLETARRIRAAVGEDVPILLISAYDWSDLEQDAREAGINGFISKPLFKSTLYYGLRKFVNGEDVASDADKNDDGNVLEGRHILLAEDNDLNWEIAQMLLEDEGVQVERAENGKVCVDTFAASAPGTYDAILMDIRMPVMTGYEAAVAIRALDRPDKDLPSVAMTADAFADDMKRCLDCGMNAHVAKPIDMDLLRATLAKFIK